MGFTLTRERCYEKDQDTKKGRKRRRNTELPYDGMVEILLKLSVKSLFRFKCVCRFWYDSIVSPNFIDKYNAETARRPKVSLYLRSTYNVNSTTTGTTISCRFYDTSVDITVPLTSRRFVNIIGCSNGIVCLSFSDNSTLSVGVQDFILYNPATRKHRLVPHLRYTYYPPKILHGFGFDPVAKTFKIVRIAFYTRLGEILAGVCMFTSNDNAWRKKILDVPHRFCCCNMTEGISAKGRMYWMINESTHRRCALHPLEEGGGDNYILCFDMVDELFKRIEFPSCRGIPCHKLVGYKESLAMFVSRRSGFSPCGYAFDVWVLSDCNKAWSKQFTVRPPADDLDAEGFLSKCGDADFVVFSRCGRYYMCNLKTGETYGFFAEEYPDRIFSYSESLASV